LLDRELDHYEERPPVDRADRTAPLARNWRAKNRAPAAAYNPPKRRGETTVGSWRFRRSVKIAPGLQRATSHGTSLFSGMFWVGLVILILIAVETAR
jgi:hypothetical protein